MAWRACSGVVTVPIPSSAAPAKRICSLGSSSNTPSVLRVSSIERTPPAPSASMTGAYSVACRARSTATTPLSAISGDGAGLVPFTLLFSPSSVSPSRQHDGLAVVFLPGQEPQFLPAGVEPFELPGVDIGAGGTDPRPGD